MEVLRKEAERDEVDIDSLEKIMVQRFTDLEDKMRIHVTNQAQSVLEAANAIDRRLNSMNELREQISRERGIYVTRDLFTSELGASRHASSEAHAGFDTRIRGVEVVVANYEGRIRAFGALMTLLNILISVIGVYLAWKK